MRADSDDDPDRARFNTLRGDFPGYEIRSWPDGCGGRAYTAVARHQGMDPPSARAATLGQLRDRLAPSGGTMPLDATIPNAARIYDYWLGGKDNFAADRQAGDHVLAIRPEVTVLARRNRAFTTTAVRWACAQGVGQVLDLGAGLPTEARTSYGNLSHEWEPTHLAAQSGYPMARCVAVDNDPVVIRHWWAVYPTPGDGPLLTDAVAGDLRDPEVIWSLDGIRTILDLDAPLVLVLTAVLHFLPPDRAKEIVGEYVARLAPGSYVVLSVGCGGGQAGEEIAAAYNDSDAPPIHNYTRGHITGLLDGLDLVPPYLVPAERWRPGWDEPRLAAGAGQAGILAAVGRKTP
ncbi:MAG TPA: SAM-dependent methyltransferase [Urbifossiella sp.]|nr:SAM-dependent methyltransferase [Urbifossiella sp.]